MTKDFLTALENYQERLLSFKNYVFEFKELIEKFNDLEARIYFLEKDFLIILKKLKKEGQNND